MSTDQTETMPLNDLDVAVQAAKAGADVVRNAFGSTFETEFKGIVNPVTEIDRRAEQAILMTLRAHRPNDALVAEESGGDTQNGRRWIIDPLDGTVNFLHGVPQVAVTIGLYDQHGLAGVTLDVLRDDVFLAVRERGATRNGHAIRVSEVHDLGLSLLGTGFPYDRQERASDYAAGVEAALRSGQGVRRLGSAALDFAWVACGRFDGYWEFDLHPWDVAAGIMLVNEAGGRVTNEHGKQASLNDRLFIASNGHIHDEFAAALAPTIERVLG